MDDHGAVRRSGEDPTSRAKNAREMGHPAKRKMGSLGSEPSQGTSTYTKSRTLPLPLGCESYLQLCQTEEQVKRDVHIGFIHRC